MTYLCVCWLVFICSAVLINGQYEVPEATVEAFTPNGFRVSIPDEEGITLFAFHGKINEEMNGRESGVFSRDITKAKEGRWTFYDSQAKLGIGDTLYYWTFVDYFDGERKLGYVRDDQSYTITELLPKPKPGKGNNKGNQGNGNKGNGNKGNGNKGNSGNAPGHNKGNGHKNKGEGSSGETHPPIEPVTITPRDPEPEICVPSVTTVKGITSCKGHLIFQSQFQDFLEDKGKFWTVQRKYAAAPDYEFVLYEENPRTLSVYDGNLVISPVLTDDIYGNEYVLQSNGLDLGEHCTGIKGSPECYQKQDAGFIISPVVSSQISTQGKFSFKYGKIEIRAKLPKGDWLYPQLFLNSENQEYGPNYESGQIRIAFAPGNQRYNQKLEGGIILGNKPAARNYAMKSVEKNTPWGNEFHNYTILWTPTSITLSVDNSVYGTIFPPEGGFSSLASNLQLKNSERWKTGSNIAPFDKEMYILVGVGAGGHNFEDRTDGTKPWVNNQRLSQKNFYKNRTTWRPTWGDDAKLYVDYVKVWALDL